MIAPFNENGIKEIEPGLFRLFVGGSSPGKRSNELGTPIKEVVFNIK